MTFNPNTLTVPGNISVTTPFVPLGLVSVEAYGAVGDAYQILDGAANSGSNPTHLTSAGSHFKAFTGTKTVVVNGAGAVVNGLVTDLVTTGTFSTTGLIILGTAVSTTVSGATVSVGTDNTTAIQNALNDIKASSLTIANGLYLCGSALVIPGGKIIYGAGVANTPIGILGAGSLYSYQTDDVSGDPICGVGGSIAITSATQSGNVATYVFSGAAPAWMNAGYFNTGSIVTVSGMLAAGYNATGTVLSATTGSFTMVIETSGLGSSSQGGTCTSQSGKKYVAYNQQTGGNNLDGKTAIYNLNFLACNALTTVAWGVLFNNTVAVPGDITWEYDFHGCSFSGWIARHLMWANGVAYDGNCDLSGLFAADAFTTLPTSSPVIQKVTDVATGLSCQQTTYGKFHYEYNPTATAGLFSTWTFTGGYMENSLGIGDFTGSNYVFTGVHIERVTSTVNALIQNIPSTAGTAWISPELDTTMSVQTDFTGALIAPAGNQFAVINNAGYGRGFTQPYGSWTPTDASGGSLTFSGVSVNYSQIGNLMCVYGTLTFPSTGDTNNNLIDGLPVKAVNHPYATVPGSCWIAGLTDGSYVITSSANSTEFAIRDPDTSTRLTNAALSGLTIDFVLTYPTI